MFVLVSLLFTVDLLRSTAYVRTYHIEKENSIVPHTVAYIPINNLSRIVRASWHQGNDKILTSGYAGVQYLLMDLTNIVFQCHLGWRWYYIQKGSKFTSENAAAVHFMMLVFLTTNLDVIRQDFLYIWPVIFDRVWQFDVYWCN